MVLWHHLIMAVYIYVRFKKILCLKGCNSAQRYIYLNFSARPIKNPHYFFFVQVLFYFSLDKKKKYANPYKIVCFQFTGGQNFLHPGGQEYFFFADIQVIWVFLWFLFCTMLKPQYSYYCFKANSWQQQKRCVLLCGSFVTWCYRCHIIRLGYRHYYWPFFFLFIIWSWKYAIFLIILIFF